MDRQLAGQNLNCPGILEAEELNTLSYWALNLPGGRKAVNVNTLHRWRLKGFCGVAKLECIRRGLEWETSREALLRFFQALNPQVQMLPETPAARQRRNEAAKYALKQMGIIKDPDQETPQERGRRLARQARK